jgi:hypothetical protein
MLGSEIDYEKIAMLYRVKSIYSLTIGNCGFRSLLSVQRIELLSNASVNSRWTSCMRSQESFKYLTLGTSGGVNIEYKYGHVSVVSHNVMKGHWPVSLYV